MFYFPSFLGGGSCLKHSQARRQLCPETLGTNIALVWVRRFPPAQAAWRDHYSAFNFQVKNGSPSKARNCIQPRILTAPWFFSPHLSLCQFSPLNSFREFNPGSSVPLDLLLDIPNILLWKCHPSQRLQHCRVILYGYQVPRLTCWKKPKQLYIEFSPWVLLPWHRGNIGKEL